MFPVLLALSFTINVGAVVAFVGSLAAFCAAVGVLARLRPVKWFWRRVFLDPGTQWLEKLIGRVVDERLDARPILNGKGEKMISVVNKVAEVVGVDAVPTGR